jgi:hypothetical protein
MRSEIDGNTCPIITCFLLRDYKEFQLHTVLKFNNLGELLCIRDYLS